MNELDSKGLRTVERNMKDITGKWDLKDVSIQVSPSENLRRQERS